VFVVLEATIGFNQHDEDDAGEELMETSQSSARLNVTSQDLKFLKSLRISVGEDQ
jgi:hypothetical protein